MGNAVVLFIVLSFPVTVCYFLTDGLHSQHLCNLSGFLPPIVSTPVAMTTTEEVRGCKHQQMI